MLCHISYLSLTVKECYRGNGESYRGATAVTREGTPCIKWTMSEHANPSTHPDKVINVTCVTFNMYLQFNWYVIIFGGFSQSPYFQCGTEEGKYLHPQFSVDNSTESY